MDNKEKVLSFITEKTAELKRLKRSSTAVKFSDIRRGCGLAGSQAQEATEALINDKKISGFQLINNIPVVYLY